MPSLWFNGDLTAGTGAPPAAPGNRLDGYVTSNDQMHINYVDADGHVHELGTSPRTVLGCTTT